MDAMTITITFPIRFIELLLNSINLFRGFVDICEEGVQPRGHPTHSGHQGTHNPAPCEQQQPTNARPTERSPPPDHQQSQPSASSIPQETDEDAALRAEISRYREKNAELIKRFEQLHEQLKRKKIESFEDLIEHDKEALKVLIELARLTPPMTMEGNNIGLFGLTSTGKSTMLNALLGQPVATTGVGETTTEIKSYKAPKFTLWDVPGKNDELNYLSMEYISFFKGLTQRFILIQATVKENSSMSKFLDGLGLNYTIVFNKFDKVDEDERAQLQEQINNEIKSLGLKEIDRVFFVSSKVPAKFLDWHTMVHHMENPPH